MATPSRKFPDNRRNVGKFKFDRDDIVLTLILFGGISLIIVICMFSPLRQYVVKPMASIAGSAQSQVVEDAQSAGGFGFGSGLYSLGRVLMTLGQKNEYVDSEIDLEYNGRALTLFSNGEIRDSSGARQYFKGEEGKIRDAIVRGSGMFSVSMVHKSDGIDRFKSQLVTSVNENLRSEQDLVTNIYFRKFIVIPAALAE